MPSQDRKTEAVMMDEEKGMRMMMICKAFGGLWNSVRRLVETDTRTTGIRPILLVI